MMFKIQNIDHIVLRTASIKQMIAFYCEVLGCVVEREVAEISLVQLRAGRNLIDLVEVKQDINKDNHNLEHFCLAIQPFDFEYLKQYFQERQIEIVEHGKRYGAEGMGYSLYIQDPEGNTIELREKKPD